MRELAKNEPAETLAELAAFPVHRRLTTRWSDNDANGHLNNVVFYALFDSAVTGWLMESSGVDIRTLPAVPVLAETSCRFLRDLSFPDDVTVGIGAERVGRTSVTYALGLFRDEPAGAAPSLRARGRFVQVFVDAATRRPVPIPEPVRRALAGLGARLRD
ncbi:acyl-CoA thioesterase [Pseudonocardia sp. GCM10023141]|uniref:acyl-CoA thioesterase n=1 Tax=Pseudonocardia sp. GCM10023141 TaxID=3252653 RepID=UPI00361D534A